MFSHRRALREETARSIVAGIYAILSQLGIIAQDTKIAGSSAGGLIALAHCAGLADRLPEVVADLSDRCRRKANCQKSLDRGVRDVFRQHLSADAYQHCTNVAYVSITTDKFPKRRAKNLMVSHFRSKKDLVDAAAATSYIPMWSGKNLTTKFQGKDSYDGFFSNPQPCPPGVGYCIRINSANPPWSNNDWAPLLSAMAKAASLYAGRKPRLASAPLGGYGLPSRSPLIDATHPNITAFKQAAAADVDIAPGIFSATGMRPEAWADLLMLPGDEVIRDHLYRLGRQDGQAWAETTGLAAAARARKSAQFSSSQFHTSPGKIRAVGAQITRAGPTAASIAADKAALTATATTAAKITLTAAEAVKGGSNVTYSMSSVG